VSPWSSELLRECLGSNNVFGLRPLGATAQQHHNGLSVLDVVNPPARTDVDPQLAESFSYWSGVARKTMGQALQPCEYSAADGAVLEARQPVCEGWQGLERVHPSIVVDR
jgi:hypothetical protein